MKRGAMIAVCLVAAMTIGAQGLRLGTMEGTMRYAPVVISALKEAGYESSAKGYPTQIALLEALGKGEIDAGFFIPQPVIQTIKGAVMIPVKLGESRFDALTTDPNIKITRSTDLKDYKVGIVKDHSGHVAVTRGIAVTTAPSDYDEFKLLVDGKVQVIIALEELVPILSKPAGLKTYYTSLPLLRTPNFLALSAAKAGEAAKIEAILKKWVEGKKWEAELAKIDGQPSKK